MAVFNPGAIAATMAAFAAGCARARADNLHSRRGVPLIPVPLYPAGPAAGGAPAGWPAGFDRVALFEGAIAVVDALLTTYGLPAGAAAGSTFDRRNALAAHLGTHGT
jgi:hypothetical protein